MHIHFSIFTSCFNLCFKIILKTVRLNRFFGFIIAIFIEYITHDPTHQVIH